MGFGIAKGFHMEKRLQEVLLEKFAGQEEVIGKVIEFANTMLEQTKGGLIAGVGVALLFYFVIRLLNNIENSFNDIWGIQKGRSFARKLSDYLSMILICPILLVMSSSMTALITTQVERITEKISLLGAFSPLIFFGLKVLPYVVIWLLFTFVYIFMPNIKVHFRSALLGGVVGGTIYQIVQWVYFTFQVGVSRNNAIYGSFAALPLFLIWLQTSWMIMLFGAEISFASQHVDTYEFEPDALEARPSFRRLLALRIAHLCVKNFQKGVSPLSAEDISHQLEVPIRLVNRLLFELEKGGILTTVRTDSDSEALFQPARDITDISLASVMQALDNVGTDKIPLQQTDELLRITDSLRTFQATVEQSEANLLLKDI
jgi:membrane protein